jgi:broad specificity phosphatase PhoE
MNDTENFRRIYIRHADKEYANGDANLFKHDPGITSDGISKTKMVANHLLEQWGLPDRIIASPYRRTRETAAVMNSLLGNKVPMHIDTDVAEYLGNHRTVPIDVTESTLVHDPPHPESFTQMKSRVKDHHNMITNYSKKKKIGVIWIVTHGIIIKQVAALIGVKMPKDFPNLTCLSIVDGEKITKSELLIFNENASPVEDDSENSESIVTY